MKHFATVTIIVLSAIFLASSILNTTQVEAQMATASSSMDYLDNASQGNASVITPGVLTFHAADSTIAYNWFSYVPNSVSKADQNTIWLTGIHGNLITDDYNAITAESQQHAAWRSSLAEDHKYIMLVPVIPRPATNHVYAVAFDWKVFLPETDPFVQRPDLKLNLMIDQLLADLRAAGYNVDDRVFIDGFSAGAMFAQRYALLHPERVRAIAAGQCGGAMTMPESIYTNNGVTQMDWPVGVSDFSALVGEDFDRDAYRDVPQLIYIGDQDTNNSTLWGTGELWRTQAQIDFLNAEFGNTDPVRLEHQASYLAGLGYSITFKLYPGVGHQFTNQMIDDTFAFFWRVRYPHQLYLPLVLRDSMPQCTLAPTPLSPLDGSALNTLIPKLRYMRGSDPVSYTDITIADNPTFDAPIEVQTSGGGIGPLELRMGWNLKPATRYYWRMVDVCDSGQSPYSPTFTFITGSGGIILPAPTLASPADGTAGIGNHTTLTWNMVGGAVGYKLHVCAELNCGNYYTSSASQEVWYLDPNSAYQWHVEAYNDYAYGNTSAVWQFSTGAFTLKGAP